MLFALALLGVMGALALPEFAEGQWLEGILAAGSITLFIVGVLAFVEWRRTRTPGE